MNVLECLQADYQRFPKDQTYSLYAEDVFFKDPMTSFRGRDRYHQMIGFIDTWFRDPQLDLHDIQQRDRHIRTDWTLHWTTPLPWQPRIQISGWTDIELNADGLIISHIDHWHCSKWAVVRQHFGGSARG